MKRSSAGLIPRIVETKAKKLVGSRKLMSLVDNKTAELWRESLDALNAVYNRVGRELFSLQKYPKNYFLKFDPATQFEKWAAVEVSTHQQVPASMESMTLPAGLYAVFRYGGSSAEASKVFQFIYGEWLPNSEFILDDRPHFEILGEKYKNNDPDSEEDIWIPVRTK